MTKSDLKKLEQLYIKSCDDYYGVGESKLSDEEFDALEQKLKSLGSKLINKVNSSKLSDETFEHLSPMQSLDKLHVHENRNFPITEFFTFLSNTQTKSKTKETIIYEIGPKLDGCSGNLIYENGELNKAISRGDGIKGQSLIEKLIHIVPKNISNKGIVEVRGEVVIPFKLFEEKYLGKYKNPRNFVAGILSRDEIDLEIIKDFVFIAYDAREQVDNNLKYLDLEFLVKNKFDTEFVELCTFKDKSDFGKIFDKFSNFRENESKYQLDGYVIKVLKAGNIDTTTLRNNIGKKDKYPLWAMAIKFPPKRTTTFIKSINWFVGTYGEFTPVAVIEPIDLDGTTVSNVSLYNLGNVKTNGLLPGAEVVIAKSGDIIPIVLEIIKPSSEDYKKYLPTECSCSECNIVEDGIHLICDNPVCPQQLRLKLGHGISSFKMKGIGDAIFVNLYNAGIESIIDVFDNEKWNEDFLINSGYFKEGKALSNILDARKNVDKDIPLASVIHALAFKNIGSSIAVKLCALFEGTEMNTKGVNKEAIQPFYNENSFEYKRVVEFIQQLIKSGYSVKKSQVQNTNSKGTFEMTGSTKEFGYKSKADVIKVMESLGYSHASLSKDSSFLLTGDIDGDSSKMQKAKKLKVKIISYSDMLNI